MLCVEAVCGFGAPPAGPAVPDQRDCFQEDRQAGRHLLGCDETLWSNVSYFGISEMKSYRGDSCAEIRLEKEIRFVQSPCVRVASK